MKQQAVETHYMTPVLAGSVIRAFDLEVTDENDQPYPLVGFQVKCQFRPSPTSEVFLSYSTQEGSIVIDGHFVLFNAKAGIRAGKIWGDVKIYPLTGEPWTLARLELDVQPAYTR